MRQATRPTILIVDDQQLVRLAVRDSLCAGLPLCCYMEAASGEEAVCISSLHTPTVVLLDVHLPGISGIEAARRIKVERPLTLVVMLSHHEELAYRLDAAEAGADHYLFKRRLHIDLVPLVRKLLDDR